MTQNILLIGDGILADYVHDDYANNIPSFANIQLQMNSLKISTSLSYYTTALLLRFIMTLVTFGQIIFRGYVVLLHLVKVLSVLIFILLQRDVLIVPMDDALSLDLIKKKWEPTTKICGKRRKRNEA